MTLGSFNALLKGTSTYVKIEIEDNEKGEKEKILWLMVEKNKGDEEAQDVPIIRINGPERTPAKAMIEQCHTMLLKSGTKMAMTAYAQRIERKHQEAEEKSKKSEKKPVAKKKPKKAKTPKK